MTTKKRYAELKVDRTLHIGAELEFGTTKGAYKQALIEPWRLRVGEAVTIKDSCGALFRARATGIAEGSTRLYVFEETGFKSKVTTSVTLIQALPEKERMELIIQKATELGVDEILPFKSQRSISLREREATQKKAHKWGEVALRAAKQSRRHSIPRVLPYTDFEGALCHSKASELRLMLREGPGLKPIKEAIVKAESVALMVGPEGGFTDKESEAATEEGFIEVSLGDRILRTETAAIAAVCIIGHEFGL